MSKPKVLIQFDTDQHPSSFDAVVAVDAGVDHLLQYARVTPETVEGLVHGAMFTRSPADLRYTAIFIGGSSVEAGERLLERVQKCFFGPMRVSVLLDANGANTTAAAAVLAAGRHLDLSDAIATVLAGTGPVGQRAARLLAAKGAQVRIASRTLSNAEGVCKAIQRRQPDARLSPVQTQDNDSLKKALRGATLVVAAGAAGVELLPADILSGTEDLKVAIDLNAVPPTGISGIQPQDKAVERGGPICYGALGVGGTKMKIHRAAIERLFTANDLVLDAEEILSLGEDLSK